MGLQEGRWDHLVRDHHDFCIGIRSHILVGGGVHVQWRGKGIVLGVPVGVVLQIRDGTREVHSSTMQARCRVVWQWRVVWNGEHTRVWVGEVRVRM